MTNKQQRELLQLLNIDTSLLTAAEIKTGAELMRRISQCERVPGANQRRPAAIEAWQDFLKQHAASGLRAASNFNSAR